MTAKITELKATLNFGQDYVMVSVESGSDEEFWTRFYEFVKKNDGRRWRASRVEDHQNKESRVVFNLEVVGK